MKTGITTTGDIDIEEDDNAIGSYEAISPSIENFIDDLVETIDAYLWTLNAVIPHQIYGSGDVADDTAEIMTKKEKEELFDEIYAVFDSWFGQKL